MGKFDVVSNLKRDTVVSLDKLGWVSIHFYLEWVPWYISQAKSMVDGKPLPNRVVWVVDCSSKMVILSDTLRFDRRRLSDMSSWRNEGFLIPYRYDPNVRPSWVRTEGKTSPEIYLTEPVSFESNIKVASGVIQCVREAMYHLESIFISQALERAFEMICCHATMNGTRKWRLENSLVSNLHDLSLRPL